jgi:hypothetical protein
MGGGAELASALIEPAVQTSTLLGMTATTWLGGVAGFVTGTAANYIPVSGIRRVRETEYTFDGKKIEIPDGVSDVTVKLKNLPKVKLKERETTGRERVVSFINSQTKFAGAVTLGLTGAFTMAATGLALGTAFKMAAIGSKAKDRAVSAFRKDYQHPSP